MKSLSGKNDLDASQTYDDAAGSGKTQSVYTIGEVARKFDVTHRALRFYEDRGLLTPKRDGQNRLYSRRDVARLKLVLMGKRVGFSLTEIREMLNLYDLRDGQVTQLRVALGKFEQQISVLEQQQRDVQEALTDLRRTREIVAGMLVEKEKKAVG
ncbi:MAG: MerR family DNA-binding transcriptional regulator [Fimbriimonadaceae bacterium]|nr:MerR family DNA-binding transcriptional regulator [Alphaproteobacteria bacterium]